MHCTELFMLDLSFSYTRTIFQIISYISIMPRWLLAVSAVHFWRAEKSENLENPDFDHIKHLKNLGYFFLTAPGMLIMINWRDIT